MGMKKPSLMHYRGKAYARSSCHIDTWPTSVFILFGLPRSYPSPRPDLTRTLQRFRDGDLQILVATSIEEKGLDIPQCDLVVFYEPVPSELRLIQRGVELAGLGLADA